MPKRVAAWKAKVSHRLKKKKKKKKGRERAIVSQANTGTVSEGNVTETYVRPDRAHMGFSELTHTILT